MSILLKMPVDDGDSEAFIEVEVDQRDLGDDVELVAGRRRVAEAPYSLTSSLRNALPALRAVLAGMRSLTPGPDEVTVELGLKVGGESGLVFVKGTTEATFTVTLSWHNSAP